MEMLWQLMLLIRISGEVVDEGKGAVSGAEVRLRTAQGSDLAVGRTDAEGRFSFESPGKAEYLIRVEAQGFGAVERRAEEKMLIRLEVAGMRSAVTVRSAARGLLDEVVEVRDREEMRKRPLPTLGHALAESAGVMLQQTGTSQVSPFLRGLTGYQVLNVVDGVRFNNATFRSGPNQYLAFVDPSQAQRVEATLGPAGTQYGSDALGGTIQVVTREARGPGWHGEWNLGSATADLSAVSDGQVSWAGDKWWWLGGISGRKHNDLRAGGGRDSRSMFRRFLGIDEARGRLQDTGFTQYGLHAKVGARLTATQLFSAWYQRSEQGQARNYKDLEGGLGRLRSDLSPQVLDFGYARYEKLAWGWVDSLAGTVSWNRQLDGTVRQGLRLTDAVVTDRNEVRVWGAAVAATSHAGQRQAFAYGGEWYQERIGSERFDPRPARPLYPNGSRYRTGGFFGQDRVELVPHRLRATIGGRWTQIRYGGRDYGDFTYSANLRWQVAAGWAMHGSVGRGFRAPNVNDLGGIGLNDLGYEIPAAEAAQAGALLGSNASEGATSLGRPLTELKAERLFNYEWGMQAQIQRTEIRAQLFDAELRDPIVRRTVLFPAGAVPATLAGLPMTVIAPTPGQRSQGVVTVATQFDPRAVKAFVNDGASRYYGVETVVRTRWGSGWTVEGNYSYLVGRDLNPNRNIRRLPPQQGWVGLTRARSRYWWRASAVFAGAQRRLSGGDVDDERIGGARSRNDIAAFVAGARYGGRETVRQIQDRVLPGVADGVRVAMYGSTAGWVTGNVQAGWTVTDQWSLVGGVFNVFDRNYRVHGSGVDAPGVNAFVGVRWAF